MSLARPPALRPGDAVGLVAPSGPVDRERIKRAIERFEQRGLGIKTFGDIYRTHGYCAGDDQTRAAELNAAFADKEITAVVPARGGYGVSRILDRLDFTPLVDQPKLVTGFSDITALHLAIGRHVQLVTFHSPNPQDGLGTPDGLSDLAARTFWRAVLASEYDADATGYEIPLTDEERQATTVLNSGTARGPIVGGNLAVLAALVGTPYDFDPDDGILLIEDVGEEPHRVDRFLSQLRLAGKLDGLAGVIVGQFTDCASSGDKPSFSVDELLEQYLAPLRVPVLANYPVGHTRDNATLPLGVGVEFDADSGRITVLENPVELNNAR